MSRKSVFGSRGKEVPISDTDKCCQNCEQALGTMPELRVPLKVIFYRQKPNGGLRTVTMIIGPEEMFCRLYDDPVRRIGICDDFSG